jgi:hypothetical protein
MQLDEQDIFRLGVEAFLNGWKRIPPYALVSEYMSNSKFKGGAYFWMSGWDSAKNLEV